MTLDEAIKHCDEVAEKNETKGKMIQNNFSKLRREQKQEIDSCLECASEHRQLAEWLLELKNYQRGIERIKELTDGKGASFFVETSGAQSALIDCINAARRYARISVVSFYERDINGIPMDKLVLGCYTLVGAAGCYGNAPAVCEIMSKNPVSLAPVITHHVPFEDCLDVFENEEKYHKTKIKVMVDFK